MFRKHFAAIIALASCFAGSGQAAPTLSVSSMVGGGPAGNVFENLNELALGQAGGVTNAGVAVTFSGNAAVVAGSSANFYAAPVLSNGDGAAFGDADGADASRYISTGSNGASAGAAVTFTLPTAETYFGLAWGSVDSYDTLAFYDGATLIEAITGSDVLGSANGDESAAGTAYVNITSSVAFTTIVASSSQYAFELDDLSFNSPAARVPEPTTLAVLGMGLAGFGFAKRHRHGSAAAGGSRIASSA